MNARSAPELAQRLAAEQQRFHQERERHFLPQDTRPLSVGEPFFLPGGAQRGVLLVHGLMAAPEEVREWAESLNRQGLTVYAPRLAGHGTSAADLAARTAEEWMASVERGRRILACCCREIVIAGFSTGGALALASVIRRPDAYRAVISISAPLRLRSWKAALLTPLDACNRLAVRWGRPHWQHAFVHNPADNPHINYLRCPVRSLVEIRRLMQTVRQGLPEIRIPALVMHAHADPKVDVRGGRDIYRRLGSARKHYQEIEWHLHGIVRGEIGLQVFRRSGDFLAQLRP
jgi:esterase/lipase